MALVSTFGLTGCLKLETRIELRADGSGIQSVSLAIPDELVEAARRQATALNAGGLVDPRRIFDEEAVRAGLTAARLRCRSYELNDAGRRRKVSVQAEFDDIAGLRRTPLSCSGAEWKLLPGSKPGRVRVIFYPRGRAAFKSAREQARKMPNPLPPREAALWAKRRAQMAGIELRLVISLPGDVIAHTANMTKTGPREVEVTVDEASIRTPQDLVGMLAPRYEVVIDGRACALPIDGQVAPARRAAPARAPRRSGG